MNLEAERVEVQKQPLSFIAVPKLEVFSPESTKEIEDIDYYFKAMSIMTTMADGFLSRHLFEADPERIKSTLPLAFRSFRLLFDLREQTDKLSGVFTFRKTTLSKDEEEKARAKIDRYFQELMPNFQPNPLLTINNQEDLDLMRLKMGLAVDHDLRNIMTALLGNLQLSGRYAERGSLSDEEAKNYAQIVNNKCHDLRHYLSVEVLRFLQEKRHQDEVPATTEKVRDTIQRYFNVDDYAVGLNVKVNIDKIPEQLKDQKVDLPQFLLQSVIINLASNAGKAALLRQDAERKDLMKPDKTSLPHVEPEVQVEFLSLEQTQYPIEEDKKKLFDPHKNYMLVVTQDNFIGYPEDFVKYGFTGISGFRDSKLTNVTGTGVGMVGMERFIKPYGGAFILQNRGDILGAITIWAVPLLR